MGVVDNAGIWGLIWDPNINTDGSRRFIQGVIDKYNHTPTSRCYLGYAAMMQILEAMQRTGSTDTAGGGGNGWAVSRPSAYLPRIVLSLESALPSASDSLAFWVVWSTWPWAVSAALCFCSAARASAFAF